MEALLSKEQLKDIFGSTDVSISERAEYFGNLWDSWEDNQVILPQKLNSHAIKKLALLLSLEVKKRL